MHMVRHASSVPSNEKKSPYEMRSGTVNCQQRPGEKFFVVDPTTLHLVANPKNSDCDNRELNPISTGGCFPPPICFLPVTFLFLSQFPPNLVTFSKI